MTDFSEIANKPKGFDLTTLEAMIDNAATNGGQFMPITFKSDPAVAQDYISAAFPGDLVTTQNRGVVVTRNGKSCVVSCNGYVTGWKDASSPAPIKLKGFSGSPISSDDPAENVKLGHAAEEAAEDCEGKEKASGYRIAAGYFEKATEGRSNGHYIDRARALREEADKIDPPARVDLTPTFEEAVNMCLVVLESGTEEGKAMAREELRRYARELDRLAQQSGSAFSPNDTPMEGE